MKCESRRCSWSAKFDDRPYRATVNHLLGLVGAAETPSRQNRSITTQCGRQAHGLPRQRELRGDRSSAIQRPHRHDRGPSGCLASLSPSSCDMVAHPDVLRAKGRGLKWRRFSVAGDGRGMKGRGQLDVEERGVEGGYIASVRNALKATTILTWRAIRRARAAAL